MKDEILNILKDVEYILASSENVRFEIAYSRNADMVSEEEKYVDELHQRIISAIAELERSDNG